MQRVRANGRLIDALEEQVNEEAVKLVALRAPIASDMRTVLSVIRISTNLKPIGDHAKNLAKRTGVILQLPQVDGALQSIRRMARAVEQMLRDVLDAYTQRDAELAMEVRNRDQDIDQMYNAPARTGDEAMTVFVEVSPDPAALDWMLPGVSGIEICRQMKRQSDTREVPVIMLSARTEEADRARRLETGADDYVTKPYQALFSRRTGGSHPRATPPDAACPTEFRLLATLIEKPGRVWSREQLLDHVWGRDIYRR